MIRALCLLPSLLLALLLLGGCHEDTELAAPSTNSNSNWLTACQEDADCPSDAMCACGVCAAPCAQASDCGDARPGATCASVDSAALGRLCQASGEPATGDTCLPGCQADADCAQGWTCQEQACAPAPNCEEDSLACGAQLGRGDDSLYVCARGEYVQTQQCSLGCLTLTPSQAACATYDCDELPEGQFCAAELALPQGFWFACSPGSPMTVLGACQDCVPNRGAAVCR